jgi:hypothetical protein
LTRIISIGAALFGPSWQTPLAEALDVNIRTVQRWVAGQPVPDGAWDDIAAIAKARKGEIEAVISELAKRAA